jgi:hypothetical protein
MFTKTIIATLSVLATVTSGVVSKPLPSDVDKRTASYYYGGFNQYGGSLSHFDDFYGQGNFNGYHNQQTVVEEKHVVCHSQEIEIVQQRLVVLQEMAKRIITEQICEVETQTVVLEQFSSNFGSFSSDLRRHSGRHIGYDSNIISHYGSLVGSDGSLTSNDLGFHGSDVGSHMATVGGDNWNDSTSPSNVDSAYSLAQGASLGDSGSY